MSKTIDNIIYSNDLKTVEGVANDEITTAIIKEGVTEIGEDAFGYCSSLQSISIPNSVTEIGRYAFVNCNSLQSISIPDSVTTIGEYAFGGCENLQSVDLPLSVTTIGAGAFYKCTNLQSVVIPSSVTTIGEWAFFYCTNLQNVAIPEGVTTIGEWAFGYCPNLQNVVIPKSVTTIGVGAFKCCENLQNVTIPESVTSIGDEVFRNCKNLKEVHFGGNIEKLTGQIFDGCPNVELYAPENSLTEKAIKKNAKLKKLYKKLEQAKRAKITEIKAAGTQGLLISYCEGIGKEQKIEKVEKDIEVTIWTNELSSENESKYAKITVPEKTVQKKLSEIQTAFDEVRSEGENVTVEKLLETLKKNVESFEWEIYNEKDDRTVYLVKVLKGKKQYISIYNRFTNVIISKKVKKIKERAFSDCPSLKKNSNSKQRDFDWRLCVRGFYYV